MDLQTHICDLQHIPVLQPLHILRMLDPFSGAEDRDPVLHILLLQEQSCILPHQRTLVTGGIRTLQDQIIIGAAAYTDRLSDTEGFTVLPVLFPDKDRKPASALSLREGSFAGKIVHQLPCQLPVPFFRLLLTPLFCCLVVFLDPPDQGRPKTFLSKS